MGTIKESLTFDDILLLPQYSDVLPSETDISISFRIAHEILQTSSAEILTIFLQFYIASLP